MFRNLSAILLVGCLFLSVLAIRADAQNYTQWSLPEGAIARLGKGSVMGDVVYSPDGTRLAVASSIGIWLYDAQTYQEVALLTGHTAKVTGVRIQPGRRNAGKWRRVAGQYRPLVGCRDGSTQAHPHWTYTLRQ